VVALSVVYWVVMDVGEVGESEAREPRFEDAFEDLLRVALGAARRILGPGAAAEDVAAEALARMWVRWSRLVRLDHRDAWLLRVTTNLALDQVRRREPAVLGSLSPDAADAVVIQDSVARALVQLPRRQREVIVLRHLCDLSVVDTAKALRISPNSVKRHQQRGLATLRGREPDRGLELPDAL
jgi:RNA polymerase sigma factor (sigma-70 family)